MRLLARLEGLAASLSVGRIAAERLTDARKLNADMREALANFDPTRFGRLNQRFHEEICLHSGDEHLTELLHTEWTRLELVRRSAFWYAPGRAMKSITEHETILTLIEGGAESALIETAVRQHYLNTLEAVLSQEQES